MHKTMFHIVQQARRLPLLFRLRNLSRAAIQNYRRILMLQNTVSVIRALLVSAALFTRPAQAQCVRTEKVKDLLK